MRNLRCYTSRGVNESMTPDAYRTAYDKAIDDLTQISQTFERLTNRKKLIENVLAALQPVFDPSAVPELPAQLQSDSSDIAEEAKAEEASYSFLDVPAPLPAETDGDPF